MWSGNIVDPFTRAEHDAANQVPVPSEMFGGAHKFALSAMLRFTEEWVLPRIQFDDSDEAEPYGPNALAGLLYRAFFYADALVALHPNRHFQTIVATTRPLLEICVEMALLDQAVIPDGANRLRAGTKAKRLVAARRLVGAAPTPDVERDAAVFIRTKAAEIERAIVEYWGVHTTGKRKDTPKIPERWYNMDLLSGARKAGLLHHATHNYDLRNWLSHGSLAGVAGIEAAGFAAITASAYRDALMLFGEIMLIVGRQFRLDGEMADYPAQIAWFRKTAVYLAITDSSLIALGRPSKLFPPEPRRQG